MPVNEPVPGCWSAAGADAAPGMSRGDSRAGTWLVAILLLATAAFDLTRCGLVLATARHPALSAGLVAAGLVAAAVSIGTARACLSGRHWPIWAALLIGAASAPQAAVSGFDRPYTSPDTATAALGILLAVAVLATAGPTRLDQHTETSALSARRPPDDPNAMMGQDLKETATPRRLDGAPAGPQVQPAAAGYGPGRIQPHGAGTAALAPGAAPAAGGTIWQPTPTPTAPATDVAHIRRCRAYYDVTPDRRSGICLRK